MNYLNLKQLIDLIEGQNRDFCINVLNENEKRFRESPGSLTKHQAWTGGYVHHLEEAMNFGRDLFNLMDSRRKLDFSVSDVILVLFLHHIVKPFRYVEPKTEFHSDEDKKLLIERIIDKYGIILSENHKNALQYIHGEGDEYSRTERIQKPLAAFVHICDVASARIWFDYPRQE